MNKAKYPNGYQPKLVISERIEYYTYKLNEAITDLNIESVEFYTKRLTYFMKKQKETESQTQWNKFYL